MNGMQQEIDQLKNNVADMKKNMGFDDELFDDLDDFDKKVSLMQITRIFAINLNWSSARIFFYLMIFFYVVVV